MSKNQKGEGKRTKGWGSIWQSMHFCLRKHQKGIIFYLSRKVVVIYLVVIQVLFRSNQILITRTVSLNQLLPDSVVALNMLAPPPA